MMCVQTMATGLAQGGHSAPFSKHGCGQIVTLAAGWGALRLEKETERLFGQSLPIH
jgi:hypothetical protein